MQASISAIITVLSTKGDVTETIKEKLKVEKDVEVLNRWLSVVAVIILVEEFEEKIVF